MNKFFLDSLSAIVAKEAQNNEYGLLEYIKASIPCASGAAQIPGSQKVLIEVLNAEENNIIMERISRDGCKLGSYVRRIVPEKKNWCNAESAKHLTTKRVNAGTKSSAENAQDRTHKTPGYLTMKPTNTTFRS